MDNAAALFVDAPVEEGHGARAALLTPSGPVTYAALQSLTDRAAHALRARGVEHEQRVALVLPDGPAWAATFFAALKLGAVAVPLNTRLDAAQLRTVLADYRPKAVVADRALLAATGLDAEALGPRALDFDTLVAGAPAAALAPEPVGGDAMAFWLSTSGTTGFPKAAAHCHRTLPACRHYLDVLGMAEDLRVRRASRSGRGAGGAARGLAAVPGGRAAAPPAAAGDQDRERAAAHRDREAPALPAARAGA